MCCYRLEEAGRAEDVWVVHLGLGVREAEVVGGGGVDDGTEGWDGLDGCVKGIGRRNVWNEGVGEVCSVRVLGKKGVAFCVGAGREYNGVVAREEGINDASAEVACAAREKNFHVGRRCADVAEKATKVGAMESQDCG